MILPFSAAARRGCCPCGWRIWILRCPPTSRIPSSARPDMQFTAIPSRTPPTLRPCSSGLLPTTAGRYSPTGCKRRPASCLPLRWRSRPAPSPGTRCSSSSRCTIRSARSSWITDAGWSPVIWCWTKPPDIMESTLRILSVKLLKTMSSCFCCAAPTTRWAACGAGKNCCRWAASASATA